MYWELLRVNNLHMHSENFDFMSKPISFTVISGTLACVLSRDFNIRYFLRHCLNGRSVPHYGSVFINGKKCEISSITEAHELGIYDANLSDMFLNMDVALNISIPDIPKYGRALALGGAMYEKIKALLEEFEITDINPYMMCGELNDFQKQIVMILRSYMKGARLVLFNFFANYSYSEEELKKLRVIFAKLKERKVCVLCFSGIWMSGALKGFDQYIVIEDNVIVKNVGKGDFNPGNIEEELSDDSKADFIRGDISDDAVLSCRRFPYGNTTERKYLNFDLRAGSCLGVLDSKQELIHIKDIIEGKKRGGLETCLMCGKNPLYMDKSFVSKIALLDYGFENSKIFEKLSLYDNITINVGKVMYKGGIVFNKRIQRFLVNDVLERIGRKDLIGLFGDEEGKIEHMDPEDQFVIEVCRWLCIKPKVFIFHNFKRNFSLLSSEKVGNLIHKIVTGFNIPVMIIASGYDELDFYCSEIIRL